MAQWRRIHENTGLIPGFAHWVKNLAWLWLWCELPCAEGVVISAQSSSNSVHFGFVANHCFKLNILHTIYSCQGTFRKKSL